MPIQAPTAQQWQQYGVNAVNLKNVLAWELYDYQTYAAAGQTSLTFFQTPYGSGGKTQADTNMSNAGLLPSPQAFWCNHIEIDFQPGVEIGNFGAQEAGTFINDMWAVAKSGFLTFNIGSANYVTEGPIERFPTSVRLGVAAAAADTTTAAAASQTLINYAKPVGKLRELIPLVIPKNQNFAVTLNWPTAVALPSTTAGRIGVRLVGYLARSVQ